MHRTSVLRLVAVTVAVCLGACGQSSPAPKPSPGGTGEGSTSPQSLPSDVVRVSSAASLQSAIGALRSNQTIELMAGTYVVPGHAFYLPESLVNVAITGVTGNRADVVIRGGRFGFWVNDVRGLQVRDLTIERASEHGIIFNCAAHAPAIRNVVVRDIGDQFIKANPGPGGCGVDEGIVEDSVFEYSQAAPDTYTNAIDVHFGAGWTIRGNTFRNFHMGAGGLVGPAILMWNGSRDTIVEGNIFIDNVRDIALGLSPVTTSAAPVSNAALPDHRGGRISGNTVTRRPGLPGADVAIAVADSPRTRIERNTVTTAGGYPNAIEYRFPRTTEVVITGNDLEGRIVARDGASATVSGNVVR
jgi:hypothetical protein